MPPRLPEDSFVIDEARFREVLGHFPSGVTVVTGIEEGSVPPEPLGFTCQAFCSLSLDPPMVLVAPSKASKSWPRIRRSGLLCVNVLSEDQGQLSRAFAVSGGKKFEQVKWSPGPVTGCPVLAGALAWVECRIQDVYEAGDHWIATCNVLELGVGQGKPLVFYRGGFGRVDCSEWAREPRAQ